MTEGLHSSHWGAFYSVVENGRLTAVRPFERDPAPSNILEAIPGMVHGRSRVAHPSIRQGWLESKGAVRKGIRGTDCYVRVPWDEAFDLVANELKRVRSNYGNESIFAGSYGWSSAGRFHHARSQLHRFMNCFGGFTSQVNSYSFAAAEAVLPHIIGTLHPLVGPLPSWDGIAAATKLMVCFGGIPFKNTQVESGGLGEHNASIWLKRCEEAGVEFINLSPMRQDAPHGIKSEWMPIRPNTDTALILALSQILLAENLYDKKFIETCCVGFDRYTAYLRGDVDGVVKTAAWANKITGVPAAWIEALARRMAQRQTLIAASWSLQRADHGEQPYWALIALAAMLGQIGRVGGGFGFGYGAESGQGNPRQRMANPALGTGSNPVKTRIPVARISDMLLKPGEPYEFNGEHLTYPDIKLIYWCGGNPFHHHQDLGRLARAFQKPDTIIVNECWWTSTARHADIVLPATTTLERDDVGAGTRDRFIFAMKQAVAPVGEARSDFSIFSSLAERLDFSDRFTDGRDEAKWVRYLYDGMREANRQRNILLPSFDEFWQQGYAEVAVPQQPHIPFAAFRADPVKHPLNTPSGRIEIFSETVAGFGYAECPGMPVWIEPKEWLGSASTFPLHMISNQPATRLHSQMDAAGPSIASKIQGREPIWINKENALARGISSGDIVRVWNDRGEVLAGAILSSDLMPGVVQFSTGAWYDPEAPGGLDVHGNPNVLTRDEGASRLSQAPVAHSCLVEIERWQGRLPSITIHSPPELINRRTEAKR